MKTTVTIEITPETIAYMFVGAVEGGSSYWMQDLLLKFSEHAPEPGTIWYSEPKLYTGDYQFEATYDDPEDPDKTATRLIGPTDVAKGVALMAARFTRHFCDMLDDHDSETADVFMQCVVLGDVVYG